MYRRIRVQHIIQIVSTCSIAKNTQIILRWVSIFIGVFCVLITTTQSKMWNACTREHKHLNISDSFAKYRFWCIFGNNTHNYEHNDVLISRKCCVLEENECWLILTININAVYQYNLIQIAIFFQIIFSYILLMIWMHFGTKIQMLLEVETLAQPILHYWLC